MDKLPLSHFTRQVARAKEMLAQAVPGSLAEAWAVSRLEEAETELAHSKRSTRATASAAAPTQIQIQNVKGIKMPSLEKDRLAAILCIPLVHKYPTFAQHLAFNTSLSVEEALECLAVADRGATAQASSTNSSSAPNRLGTFEPAAAAAPVSAPDLAVSWADIASKLNDEARANNSQFIAPIFH